VAGEKIHRAFDVVDNDSVEVFGTPGEATRQLLEQIQASGVRVTVNPNRLGGLDRAPAPVAARER
jgi:hypothetical protein